MGGFRGVRPKGNGIEVYWQCRGARRSHFIPKPPTPRNLQDAASLRKRLIESDKLGEGAEVSFEDCATKFLKEKAKVLKPSTLDGYRSKLAFYWSGLASMPIGTIRLKDLAAIDSAVEWKSQKTRRDAHAVVSGVFQWAMKREFCLTNPALLLERGQWQRPEIDAFTDAERVAILNELEGTHKAFYGLMFETGMRTGELIALRWSDVDGPTLRVQRSTYRGKDGSTKTHQARTVALTQAAQAILKGHTSSRFAGGHVFLNQYGTPYSVDRGLTFGFRLACKRAGVRYRRPYYARHTFASRALSAGCKPSWVAAQMGDRLETVLRHYGQWIGGDENELSRFEAQGVL